MPIIGMTDRESLRPRLPILGILRKGGEKEANAPGRDLDYFRFVPEVPGVSEAFTEAHGERPTALSIYLPYDTLEDNFETWREAYTTVLQHRCDGQYTTIYLGEDGVYHRDRIPCPGGCSPVGRLYFIDPALTEHGFVGVVTFVTTSVHDIINITNSLASINDGRRLCGIQFKLYRMRTEITVPKGDHRVRRSTNLVYISTEPEWIRHQIAVARQAALFTDEGVIPSLPSGMSTMPEEPVLDGDVVEGEPVDGEPVEEKTGEQRPGLTDEQAVMAFDIKTMAMAEPDSAIRPPTDVEWKRFLKTMGDLGLTEEGVRRMVAIVYGQGHELRLNEMRAMARWAKSNVEILHECVQG